MHKDRRQQAIFDLLEGTWRVSINNTQRVVIESYLLSRLSTWDALIAFLDPFWRS